MEDTNNFKRIKIYSLANDDENDDENFIIEWVCKCGNSKLVFDKFHDELFCVSCGGVVRQGKKHYHQLKKIEKSL